MTTQAPVTIYNASAGTGKTYSLVKHYIKSLLLSNTRNKHRHLLAITFTNKAVAEMKERVLNTLSSFISYEEKAGDMPAMLEDITRETGLNISRIAEKSKTLLHEILQNYAAFDIITIDTLTHRIIRTFSKDLELPGHFEVSLDTRELLTRAVDRVVDKAGSDNNITQALVNFALHKTDEDKDWNITRDLNGIAQLLTKENDTAAIAAMQSHSLEDFDKLKIILKKEKETVLKVTKERAQHLLEQLASLGVQDEDFARKTFFNFIVKVTTSPIDVRYSDESKWQNEIDDYPFYKKATPQQAKDAIDSIREQLVTFFKDSKADFYTLSKLSQFSKNLAPLSTLRLIHEELTHIKLEENILPISDFNGIINKSLREQPTAFIYERLGERYSNYFIDEFQDTSILQWNNLIPLIENAIISESQDSIPNSLLLVGDPKQAIYRWRGGKAEQFAELSQGKATISNVETAVVPLEKNYRSYAQIVDFNNAFFSHVAPLFSNEMYANIYAQDNKQDHQGHDGGLVSISLMEAENKAEKNEVYPPKVREIINTVTQDGFEKSDICILVRKNEHGAILAQFLADHNIKVVSSDSLFINSSDTVVFITDILTLQNQPKNQPVAIRALDFLARKYNLEDLHLFLDEWLQHKDAVDIYQYLEKLSLSFSSKHFASLPLYEGVEYIIRSFHLENLSDAFVVGFLEVTFNYTTAQNKGLVGFLSYWEEKKSALSIKAPLQKDAIQIMTVHKSKGLEFPVVIFPYADAELFSIKNEHHWYDVPPEKYVGFSKLMINHSASVAHYSEQGAQRYEQRHSELHFDAINVLYVAFTRAVQRLYVVCSFRESENPKHYNTLISHYLNDLGVLEKDKTEYTFGKASRNKHKENTEEETLHIPFTSSPKEDHNIKIITRKGLNQNQEVEKAIAYGNLIHELLAQINTTQDIKKALRNFVIEGRLLKNETPFFKDKLTQVVLHPDLQQFYKEENTVYNEQAILSKSGDTFIPDRIVVLPNNSVTIIDYKTGVPKEEHSYQLDNYASLLEEMSFQVNQKLLVYINDSITVIDV